MAKRFRKQISRALKRRFHQYEHLLFDSSFRNNLDCRKELTLSYNEFVDKARSLVKRFAIVVCISLLFVGSLALFSSCNVTRRVTTESSYYQRGDTTCTIVTKTIESYDASKK